MIAGGLLLLGFGPAFADDGAGLASERLPGPAVTQTSADDSGRPAGVPDAADTSSSGSGLRSASSELAPPDRGPLDCLPAEDCDGDGESDLCDIPPDNAVCDSDPGNPDDPGGGCLENPTTCLPDEPDPGNPGGPGDDCDPEAPSTCLPGDPDNPDDPGNPGGGDGAGSGGGNGGNGGGTVGGPGDDAEQADPAGPVPGSGSAQAGADTQACSDPSLCQELDDHTVSDQTVSEDGAAAPSMGEQLAETGAQLPFPAWTIACAGALLVVAGVRLLRSQLRPSRVSRGAHRR